MGPSSIFYAGNCQAKRRTPRLFLVVDFFYMQRPFTTCAAALLAAIALPAYAHMVGFDKQAYVDRIAELQRQWHEHEDAQAELHEEAEEARATLCDNGVGEYCPPKSRTRQICDAIAWQETKQCTLGVGASKNNCVGIRRRSAYVVYAEPEDSMIDCVDVWDRLYGGAEPTIELAQKWSSPEAAEEWLTNVQWYLKRSEGK